MTTTGGQRLRAALRKGRRPPTIDGVSVGYFATSTHPDQGTPVATIAQANEYGTDTIPERPFMRRAIKRTEEAIKELVAKNIDPVSGQVDLALADMVGETARSGIVKEITDLRDPPNAPTTVAAKKSSNPLIDTGFMKNSTKHRVDYT